MSGERQEDDGAEVVKWYTRARRFPQLIGKSPDGARLPFGPYTITQVLGGVGFLVVAGQTSWLWAHFGLIGNVFALLVLGGGFVLALGRLPIGLRNPLSVATGVAHALTAPPHGRRAGTPVRLRRPHRAGGAVTVSAVAGSVATAPATRKPDPALPPAPAPEGSSPTSAQPKEPSPALTGVQRLLASPPHSDQED